MKKVALHNLGCKVNAYETEAMREMLGDAGYEIVPFDGPADVYVINTCTVTNIADRKSRQMLHRARRQNPDAIVVAAGCYVQVQEGHGADPCVDVVLGNNRKKELLRVLEEYEAQKASVKAREEGNRPEMAREEGNRPEMEREEGGRPEMEREESGGDENGREDAGGAVSTRPGVKDLVDIGRAKEYEDLKIDKSEERARGYVKVQDGCNQFCSYCIIPYARGRVRSRGREDVVQEVEALAKGGCREVVLTGIHLSSYGIDLADGNDLLSLVLAVHGVEGVERVRLGSLEPGIITEEFVRALAALPKVCPHFHLSLQSGCDETLRRMNRHYTSGEYYEKCLLLRKYFENPALTTDVIVGFPGETEEEFAASKAFVEKTCFYETHVFKYSRREGTRAAAMEGQVPEQVKSRRSDEMIRLGEQKQKEYEESLYGRKLEVLVEEETMAGGRAMWCGHTREYVKVALDGDAGMRNRLVKFILTEETEILH